MVGNGTISEMLPPHANAAVLIVDDDRDLATMLSEYLGREGFDVKVSHDGSEALSLLSLPGESRAPDLIILDVMLPGTNGIDVLRALRNQDAPPPVLMLTARGEEADRIVGLELGADDYLAKPFNPRELIARMRAILRRGSEKGRATPTEPIVAGSLHLDPTRQKVTMRGQVVALTAAEFRMLEVLVRAAGKVVSREHLTEQALGRQLELYDRSVDTHVSNLRRKLALGDAASPDEPGIRAIRGAGYFFTMPG